MIQIRPANIDDHNQIWNIIEQVIAGGDTYVFERTTPKQEMLDYWCGNDKHCFVATLNDEVVGTFIIKNNQPGLGSHIANASYMTLPKATGKGVGKTMGEFSIQEAKRLGYKAMQFNIVVATNEIAVKLWQKLGFSIIGEIPDAFNHKILGMTNAYIMHRKL